MKWLKRKIKNYLLRTLFNAVVEEDVFTYNSKTHKYYLDNKEMHPREINQLKEEVKYLKGTWIWAICQNTLRHQAKKVMFDNSKSYDDMQSGKLMLYNLDVQKNIIDKFL